MQWNTKRGGGGRLVITIQTEGICAFIYGKFLEWTFGKALEHCCGTLLEGDEGVGSRKLISKI